jgi:hypothetical protein
VVLFDFVIGVLTSGPNAQSSLFDQMDSLIRTKEILSMALECMFCKDSNVALVGFLANVVIAEDDDRRLSHVKRDGC